MKAALCAPNKAPLKSWKGRNRTTASPVDECTQLLEQYCSDQAFRSESATRSIYQVIKKIDELGMFPQVPNTSFVKYFKTQLESMPKKENFDMNSIQLGLQILSRPNSSILNASDWLKRAIESLSNHCLTSVFTNKYKNRLSVNSLHPIFQALTVIVRECSLQDSSLTSISSIASQAYFHQDASNMLALSSSSLLSAIYNKNILLRESICSEAFYDMEKSPSQNHVITFSDCQKKSILRSSILFLELSQSVTQHDELVNSIEYILSLFYSKPVEFDAFISDVSSVLDHPNFPVALFYILSAIDLIASKRSNPKSVASIAIAATKVHHDSKEKVTLELPDSTFDIDESFPSDDQQRSLCLNLIMRFLRSDSSAPLFFKSHYNASDVCKSLEFEWPIEIAQRLYISLISKEPIILNVRNLHELLLKNLDDKSVKIRSHTLKGFAQLVKIDRSVIKSAKLIPYITHAFDDPSASIREAVLDIVSKSDSLKYFSTIIKCLADPMPSVVKKSLEILNSLADQLDKDQLFTLCSYLTNFSDEDMSFKTLVKVLLRNDRVSLLGSIVNDQWFPKFAQKCQIRHNQEIRNLVTFSFEQRNYNVIRSLSVSLPRICAPHFEELLTLDVINSEICDALSAMIDQVPFANDRLLRNFIDRSKQSIFAGGKKVVRSIMKCDSLLIKKFAPESNFISDLYVTFSSTNPQTIRTLFVRGCIVRYALFSNAKEVISDCPTSLFETLADCVIADPQLIKSVKPKVANDAKSSIRFLSELAESNEILTPLLRDMLPEILENFDISLASDLLSLLERSLHFLSPLNVIHYVIAMLSVDHDKALNLLKKCQPEVICSRLSEGLELAFRLQNNSPFVLDILSLLNHKLQISFLNTLCGTFEKILEGELPEEMAIWLGEIIVRIPFTEGWQPAYFYQKLREMTFIEERVSILVILQIQVFLIEKYNANKEMDDQKKKKTLKSNNCKNPTFPRMDEEIGKKLSSVEKRLRFIQN